MTQNVNIKYILIQLSVRQLLKFIFNHISQLHVSARPSRTIFRLKFFKGNMFSLKMAPDGRAVTCNWEIWLKIHSNYCLVESCVRPCCISYIYIFVLLLKRNGDVPPGKRWRWIFERSCYIHLLGRKVTINFYLTTQRHNLTRPLFTISVKNSS